MMDSASSSISFSVSLICSSTDAFVFSSIFMVARTLSSLSKILMAYHLFWFSATPSRQCSSICARQCSTGPLNVCAGMTVPLFAAFTAPSAASIIPVSFSAEISYTGQPSVLDSCSILIVSPFLRTRSIILTAMTTGTPTSKSCVVRYKFLSRFVPSTILRMASGLSLTR